MDLPLRVVFHHPSDLRAGAGTRAVGLVAALRRHGWQVDAACEDGVAERERLADSGLQATPAIQREAGRLAAAWTRARPDLVHVEVPGPESMAWRIAAKRLGLPLTTTHHRLHNWLPAHLVATQRVEIMESNREFMLACTRVLIELPAERAELATVGLHRLSPVGNGVNTIQYAPGHRSTALRASWQAGPDTPVLIYVGRVLPAKGLNLLAETFERARQQFPDTVMVVVGDGEGRSALAERCPWVVYTGLLGGAELATVYASGDIFLFPSTIDNYGNAVIEAMASGLACVAFNRAVAAAVLRDGDNGRLVSDAAGFIAATLDLLADPAAVRCYGSAARTTAMTLTWDAIGAAADTAFRQALVDPVIKSAPGVDPLTLVVRAPLPGALPPGALTLLHRGHRLRWIDPTQEPLDVPGQALEAAELSTAWSPTLAQTEARLCAIAAGQTPATTPRRISLVQTGDLAADARVKRVAGGLRRLGHPAELTPAATAERTWRQAPPDATYLCGQATALAPLAKQLGIAVSTVALPEGVDTHLYHPGQRNLNVRHAWAVPVNGVAVMALVSVADEATSAVLRALLPLTGCVTIAGCITTAAATSLRAAGFSLTMVEGIPGSRLPQVLASADIVVLPGQQPTRSAILSTLASGAVVVLTNPVDGLPDDVYVHSGDLTSAIQALLADPLRRGALGNAGRAYAEAHTWTDAARVVLHDLGY